MLRDETTALRPEDVSEELGISPTQIRNLMRMGRFKPPIGYVIKNKGTRMSYQIYRPMLDEYLHKGSSQDGRDLAIARAKIQMLEELLQKKEKELDDLKALLRLALE